MNPPYSRLLLDQVALKLLGSVPPDVSLCLKGALQGLKTGALLLEELTPWRANGLLFSKACAHVIFASANSELSRLMILSIQPDVEDDNGDLL